jgi:WD40 repeat protein
MLVFAVVALIAADDNEIARLVRQLGDDDFDRREAASKRLAEIGEPAHDALRRAMDSDDVEVRQRAEIIVAGIEKKLFAEQIRLTGHTAGLWRVCVSADGKRLLSSSTDQTLRLWDADNGKELRVFEGHTDGVVAAALSPDGKRVLSGGGDKSVRLWDGETGKELRLMNGHTDSVLGVCFGPNGTALSVSGDRTMRMWDLETGKQTGHFRHKGFVYRVAYSPTAKLAATGCADKSIHLWDLENGKEVRTLTGHADNPVDVSFTPDGKRLLSSSYDYTVRLWDVETGKELKRIKVPNGFCSALSPDGKRAVTGGIRDVNTVRVYDLESGRELAKYEGHTGAVTGVTYFPDGKRIASASDDGTVRIWPAPK